MPRSSKQAQLPLAQKSTHNRTKLRQRREYLRTRITGRGTTVLSDFGRVIQDVPHKNVYPIKLYMGRHDVPAEPRLLPRFVPCTPDWHRFAS